jgi:CheY-like chemotaxis protein
VARAAKEKYLVLMVDDSDEDYLLVKLAMKKTERLQLLPQLFNGDEAIAYLSGQGKYGGRNQHPFPDLLLLDLKMPGLSGFDVLKWIKPQLFEDLVVVVFSGSSERTDMTTALELGAHYYQQKQVDYNDQTKALQQLEFYLVRNSDP